MYDEIILDDPEQMRVIVDDVLSEKIDLAYNDIYLKVNDNKKNKVNTIIYYMIKATTQYERELNYEEDKEIIDDYKKYLSQVQELIESFRIKDELLKAILIRNLILNGLFSSKHKFTGVNCFDNLKFYHGINIILGVGCCRNFSGFYYDLFSESYDHPILYGGILSKKTQNDELCKSNHVINLINYHDSLCGYDLYNGVIYNFDDKFIMEPFNEPSYRFRYRSYYDLLYTENSEFSHLTKGIELFSQSIGSTIPEEEYVRRLKIANRLICDNTWKLAKFNMHTYHEKDKIKQKVLTKYGNLKRVDE